MTFFRTDVVKVPPTPLGLLESAGRFSTAAQRAAEWSARKTWWPTPRA